MRTFVQRGLTAVSAVAFLASVGATPSFADTTTPYSATFPMEVTTPRACPAGAPAGAFCFTGQDHSGLGTSTPPGGTAFEDFAGFVDLAHPIPGACPGGAPGFPDHNVVTITTSRGQLFLTTAGTACGLGQPTTTDNGTWQAHGGTGIFSGARGGGTVATVGTPNPNGTINSASTYAGTLTLE